MRAGDLRHRVNVMRPGRGNLKSRGQPAELPTLRREGVPCSILQTGGSESDQSSGTYSDASYQVEFYANPDKPTVPSDYLVVTEGRYKGLRLDVTSVSDPDMDGLAESLSCGAALEKPLEVVSG